MNIPRHVSDKRRFFPYSCPCFNPFFLTYCHKFLTIWSEKQDQNGSPHGAGGVSMHIPPSTSYWSSLRVPLLLILLWWLLLFLLLMWTQRREDNYTEGLARLQLETLYSSIVDMRDWNAQNGGIFVPENPDSPANRWIRK